MVSIQIYDEMYIHDESAELIDATANGEILKLQRLIERGASPDAQGRKGWTALRRAAIENHCEAAALLLKHGASVDAANTSGQTALMIACAHGYHEMAALLLNHGANPNIANTIGRTALMIAAEHGYALVVGVVLDRSSALDLDRVDRFGKTAFQIAAELDRENIMKMLMAAGADPRIRTFKSNDRIECADPPNRSGHVGAMVGSYISIGGSV
jgi:ankyrin repeat protein